jgi:probable rRNA maturation factor
LVILEKKVAGLNEDTLERFLLRARKALGLTGQVNVLVTSSAAIRSLNQRFRNENKVTDVLSFPATPSISESRNRRRLAGEVAISADVALKNSFRLGHPPVQEIKILALHGILHLAGFDHERDNGEMARKEVKLRRALGLPVALIERADLKDLAPAHKQSPGRQSSGRLIATARPTARRMA